MKNAEYWQSRFEALEVAKANVGQQTIADSDYVPSDMKYHDWGKSFVDRGSKNGLTEVSGASTIISGGEKILNVLPNVDKAVIPIEKFTRYALGVMIEEYEKVRLRTGEIARIVEILEQGKMYIGEIIRADRHVEIDHVSHNEIASVFVEVETPVEQAV